MDNDRSAKEMEEKLNQLRELLRQAEDHMAFFKGIRDKLSPLGFPSISDADEPPTQFVKVAQALVDAKNRPQTTRWILTKTGISRSSLSQIIHRTHKDCFVAANRPGYSRKKLWSLTKEAADEAVRQLQRGKAGQPSLFDDSPINETAPLTGVSGADCCVYILTLHGNEPMSALTLAREALSRGYRGQPHGTEDEKLLRTAKSFWAALGRDERFEEVRPLVFALKN